ncbi:DUF1365 domain-containing protein [bacterium]|nr:DUF1365 domain-containing protein [bacterium]
MVTQASRLYEGWVRHRRFEPVPHSFRYRVFLLYLDLEEVAHLPLPGWLWSTSGWSLLAFRRKDHFGNLALPLTEVVRQEVDRQIGRRPTGPIRLLTQARTYGYVFNPISIYYCFDVEEKLDSLLLEVTNTPWGERHCYVLPADEVDGSSWHRRKSWPKAMHVSPFLPMDLDYRFLWTEPGSTLTGHIECIRSGRGILDATLSLQARPLTTEQLSRCLAWHPLLTLRVMVAIHWQALRLWLKRVPLFSHPSAAVERSA